jgi:hypothetical protein
VKLGITQKGCLCNIATRPELPAPHFSHGCNYGWIHCVDCFLSLTSPVLRANRRMPATATKPKVTSSKEPTLPSEQQLHPATRGMQPVLYGITILLSAFLLFQVELIMGKFLLPRFGGALLYGALRFWCFRSFCGSLC